MQAQRQRHRVVEVLRRYRRHSLWIAGIAVLMLASAHALGALGSGAPPGTFASMFERAMSGYPAMAPDGREIYVKSALHPGLPSEDRAIHPTPPGYCKSLCPFEDGKFHISCLQESINRGEKCFTLINGKCPGFPAGQSAFACYFSPSPAPGRCIATASCGCPGKNNWVGHIFKDLGQAASYHDCEMLCDGFGEQQAANELPPGFKKSPYCPGVSLIKDNGLPECSDQDGDGVISESEMLHGCCMGGSYCGPDPPSNVTPGALKQCEDPSNPDNQNSQLYCQSGRLNG